MLRRRRAATRTATCTTAAWRAAATGCTCARVEVHWISGHEDSALHSNAIKIRTADVSAEWSVAGGVRPYEHALRIAFVFRDVVFQPLNHRRHILPSWVAWVSLHRDADHIVLGGPTSDVIVERVPFRSLL